jgi:uncharacterized protein (TIRG00374 family)
MFKKKKKLIIGTFFAGVIIFILLKQVDFAGLQGRKMYINYHLLAVTFLFFTFLNMIRAERFNIVLNREIKFRELFKVTTYYNLYTGLFPGGLGELSFVYLIRSKMKSHIPAGLSCVFITRVWDILVMAGFLLLSLLFLDNINPAKKDYLAIFLIIAAIFLTAHYAGSIIGYLVKRLSRLVGPKAPPGRLCVLIDNLNRTADALGDNRSKAGTLFFVTVIFIGARFFVIKLFFQSLGLSISYFEAVLLGAICNIITLIPLNTFGGFGYQETGIALGLILIGIPKSEAILNGFIFHLLSIIFMAMLALVGLLAAGIKANKGVDTPGKREC